MDLHTRKRTPAVTTHDLNMTPADAARTKIAEGIIELATATDITPELLGDWILVAHLPTWEGDIDNSSYFMATSTETLSNHVARGLAETAIDMLTLDGF